MAAGLAPASAAPSQSPGSHLTIVDQNITGPGKNRVIVQGDEVFARARFVDGDCGSRVQNTNVVKGDF